MLEEVILTAPDLFEVLDSTTGDEAVIRFSVNVGNGIATFGIGLELESIEGVFIVGECREFVVAVGHSVEHDFQWVVTCIHSRI